MNGQAFNFSFITKYYPYYIWGLEMTLKLAACSLILGTLLGLVVALLRLSKWRIPRMLAGFWINFIRGVPVMLQVYIIYYGLSLNLPDFWASVVALSVNSSAYVGEIIRAGIQSVDHGQMEAARCVGMSQPKAMRLVILPQAIKNILPALCNEFILLIKNTSIVSIIGLHELTYRSNTVRANTYLTFEPLIISAIVYFGVTYILKQLVGVLERKMKANEK